MGPCPWKDQSLNLSIWNVKCSFTLQLLPQALLREVLGRCRAGAAFPEPGAASRSLGSEQTPVMVVQPLVMAASVCPALFTAETPGLAQPLGSPSTRAQGGKVGCGGRTGTGKAALHPVLLLLGAIPNH